MISKHSIEGGYQSQGIKRELVQKCVIINVKSDSNKSFLKPNKLAYFTALIAVTSYALKACATVSEIHK